METQPRSKEEMGHPVVLCVRFLTRIVFTTGYITSPTNPNRGVMSIVGKHIAFHRSVFWVFGRSARRAADLGMMLQK